jgi:chorismate dehydratase
MEQIELVEDYPSRLAAMLMSGEIDLGLVPVAVLSKLPQYIITGDHCIGADGDVASVCIFSEVPLEQVENIILDYQSRTSVELCQVLIRDHWKKNINFIKAEDDHFREQIRGTTAGLVIGDRAFEQRLVSPYIYDLSAAWKAYTGLPFVFAAWVATKQLPAEFVSAFNEANAQGLQHIDDVINDSSYSIFDLHHYFNDCISYDLDEKKKQGLALFLKLIAGNIEVNK